GRSADELPTANRHLPGATTKRCVATSQYESASLGSEKDTVFVSPGFTVRRLNPFSASPGWVIGMGAPVTYNWATASPVRLPVFVTRARTVTALPGRMVEPLTVRSEYWNVV